MLNCKCLVFWPIYYKLLRNTLVYQSNPKYLFEKYLVRYWRPLWSATSPPPPSLPLPVDNSTHYKIVLAWLKIRKTPMSRTVVISQLTSEWTGLMANMQVRVSIALSRLHLHTHTRRRTHLYTFETRGCTHALIHASVFDSECDFCFFLIFK